MGMRALVAYHLAEGEYGQARGGHHLRDRSTVRRAELADLAGDWMPGWMSSTISGPLARTRTCRPLRDHDAGRRQGHRGAPGAPQGRRSGSDAAHPGIKKMAEIVAVADFTPPSATPRTSPPRRPPQGTPRPAARDKWVAASITESIEYMIGAAFNEADRRDPEQIRHRVFLVDGNKQQLTAIADHAGNAA